MLLPGLQFLEGVSLNRPLQTGRQSRTGVRPWAAAGGCVDLQHPLSRQGNNPVMICNTWPGTGAEQICIEPRQLLRPARGQHPAQRDVSRFHRVMISVFEPVSVIHFPVVTDTTSGRMIMPLPAHPLEGCSSDVTSAIPFKPG